MSEEQPVKKRGRGQRGIKGKPNPVDVHVGGRMRLRRTLVGMSQEKLGEEIGLTFQQIQKYERGANRVGASRLFDVSKVLEVPVAYFFDDMPEDIAQKSPAEREQAEHHVDHDPMHRRETLELVRAYYRITNPAQRKKLFELVKSMEGDAGSDVKTTTEVAEEE